MLETYPQENMNTQAIRELTEEVFRLKQIVNEISGGGGGGADIPVPTVADVGKLLGVDDEGVYALVEGGGSTDMLSLKMTKYTPTGVDPKYKMLNLPEGLTSLAQVKVLLDSPYIISTDWLQSQEGVFYGLRTPIKFDINMIAIAQAVATTLSVDISLLTYFEDDGTSVSFSSNEATRPLLLVTELIFNEQTTPSHTSLVNQTQLIIDVITGREVVVYNPIT